MSCLSVMKDGWHARMVSMILSKEIRRMNQRSLWGVPSWNGLRSGRSACRSVPTYRMQLCSLSVGVWTNWKSHCAGWSPNPIWMKEAGYGKRLKKCLQTDFPTVRISVVCLPSAKRSERKTGRCLQLIMIKVFSISWIWLMPLLNLSPEELRYQRPCRQKHR